MVSADVNKKWWGTDYDWSEAGDEWSKPWGGPEAQWYGSLFPRVHRYLPASEIVEIACGYGRWTQFLREGCDHLTGVDISQVCVDACTERFAGDERLRFVTNDGATFPGVADTSVDLVFSYDSLVHAVLDAVCEAIAELEQAGLRVRVLSYDVRRSGMLPEAPGGRHQVYLGTGGPGHIDPAQNDGVAPWSQGVHEDASWEGPAFRLFDAIRADPEAALVAVCHTFGVLCRWSGAAVPVLRGAQKGTKPRRSAARTSDAARFSSVSPVNAPSNSNSIASPASSSSE